MEDAKLTTAARKKLSSGTFCGKNRSFPVNDCAHFRAALRLLPRAKPDKGNKAAIRACIMRRGRKLGCIKKNKDFLELVGGDFVTAIWFCE